MQGLRGFWRGIGPTLAKDVLIELLVHLPVDSGRLLKLLSSPLPRIMHKEPMLASRFYSGAMQDEVAC